jgi:hypothetical protein
VGKDGRGHAGFVWGWLCGEGYCCFLGMYGTWLSSHFLTALDLCLALLKYLVSFDCLFLIFNTVTLYYTPTGTTLQSLNMR